MTNDQPCLIALGANLPLGSKAPAATLRAALAALADSGVPPRRVSRFFSTPCHPPGAGPDFVNAAAVVTHPGPPAALLDILHRVEARFGRERRTRWAGRTLDLDLLAAGDAVLPGCDTQTRWRDLPPAAQRARAPETLILPHPRMQDRAFVLVPLAEVAPNWKHPTLDRTVLQMLDALPAADRNTAVPFVT